nr:RNA-directed DNA polymerase, eukaryota [Tanacetum cinerariifolium]
MSLTGSYTLTDNYYLTDINASLTAAVNMSLTDINASLTEHNLYQQCKLFSRGNSSTQQWEHLFTSSGKITLAVGTSSSSGNFFWQWEFITDSGNILEHFISNIMCPVYKGGVETTSHLFFQCVLSKPIVRKVSSWWNVDYTDVSSYEEWRVWLVSIRIPNKLKSMMEGVFY